MQTISIAIHPAQNPFIDGAHIWLNPDMAIMNPGIAIQRPLADSTTTGEFYGASEDGAQMHVVDIGETYESIARKIYSNAESSLPYQRFVSIMQGSLSPWLPANDIEQITF